MSLHGDLLAQAEFLATREPRRPIRISLRRSVSATYYAVFHMLVDDAVRRLISAKDRTALRRQLSRAFDHSVMKKVAQQFAGGQLSPRLEPALNGLPLQLEIVRLASVFADLQQARHEADYDIGRSFTKVEVLNLIADTKRAFSDWRTVRKSPQADTLLVGLLTFDKIRH